MLHRHEAVELTGFNNLKKALGFSFYDFVIATNDEERESYLRYINDRYHAERIAGLLRRLVERIEANVLHTSLQDYEPYGASCLLLLSDIKGGGVTMHLDKSHIAAHTYPDFDNPGGILSFRVDIELSTCGEITPLASLNDIFDFFDTDLVTIDYVVRGFTRDRDGLHVYMDHEVDSIRDFIAPAILERFKTRETILPNDRFWQLKMLRTDMPVDDYFAPNTRCTSEEKRAYIQRLAAEMRSIFNGWRV